MQVGGFNTPGFNTPVGNLPRNTTPQLLRPSPVAMRNMTGLSAANEKMREIQEMRPMHLIHPLTKGRATPRAPFMLPDIRKKDKATVRPVETVKRGFAGLPLKRRTQPANMNEDNFTPNEGWQREQILWMPDLRQTARNFTLTTSSSQIPRLEYLWGPQEGDMSYSHNILPAHLVASQISKRGQTDALTECYRNVLKENIDALAIILPSKVQDENKRRATPIISKLQNPHPAQIMALFPDDTAVRNRKSRSALPYRSPRSVAGSKRGMNGLHNPGDGQSALRTVELGLPSGETVGNQVYSTTGSGPTKSGATIPPRNTPASRPSGERADSPEAPEEEKPEENRVQIALPSDDEDDVGGPPAKVLEGAKDAESAAEAVAKHLEACGTAAEICSTASIEIKVDQTDASSMEGRSSGILIALEDDDGSQKPIEIDEADDDVKVEPETSVQEEGNDIEETENATNKRRVSITERVLKSKNHEHVMASITESTDQRKKMLEDLLQEHQQLVHDLSSMEGSSIPGSDKENEEINNKEISDKTSPVN